MGARRFHERDFGFGKGGFKTLKSINQAQYDKDILKFRTEKQAKDALLLLRKQDAEFAHIDIDMAKTMKRRPRVIRRTYQIIDTDPSIDENHIIASLYGKYAIIGHEEKVKLRRMDA